MGGSLGEEHGKIAHAEGRHQRMKYERNSEPKHGLRGLSFKPAGQRPEDRERRHGPRGQVLVDDVEGCSRYRQGEKAGQQDDATPGCRFLRKAVAADPPRAQQ